MTRKVDGIQGDITQTRKIIQDQNGQLSKLREEDGNLQVEIDGLQ